MSTTDGSGVLEVRRLAARSAALLFGVANIGAFAYSLLPTAGRPTYLRVELSIGYIALWMLVVLEALLLLLVERSSRRSSSRRNGFLVPLVLAEILVNAAIYIALGGIGYI